jgi:hypothetical protein
MLGNTHIGGESVAGWAIVTVVQGAIDPLQSASRGITVTRTGAGVYLVTIDQGVAPNFAAQLQLAALSNMLFVGLRGAVAVTAPLKIDTSPTVKTLSFFDAATGAVPTDPGGFEILLVKIETT